jgi:DNA (cytosine-5)-methyltransferase 1
MENLYIESKMKCRTPNITRYAKIARTLERSLLNAGRVQWVETAKIDPSSHTYTAADLFCGCGGISLGFKQANFSLLFGVEIDPGACASFRYNFPEAILWEMQIEQLSVDEIIQVLGDRQIQVLCAGFPCPGFSIAGLKDPKDPRNYLYKEVVRITKTLQPWFIALENVPRLVTLGNYLLAIYNAFNDIGYTISALILESASYGVPQIRPRTIFIGNRFGMQNPYPRPILNENEYVAIETAIDDLKCIPRTPKINHEWTKHSELMEKRISEVLPGGSLYKSFYDAWKRQYRGVPSMTIKENHGGNHIHYELNRVLSAREMARLQSFPDEFIFNGTMKRVLFQIGNAVPPLLAKHIALSLRPSLDALRVKLATGKPTSARGSELNVATSRGGFKTIVSYSHDTKMRFSALKSRVGKDLRGMWDVYVIEDRKSLLYYPIAFMELEEILAERERLARIGGYKLVSVEVAYEELLDRDPENQRRTGCFRKGEWFDTNFTPQRKPKEITRVERFLEKESRWLSGGPRPKM